MNNINWIALKKKDAAYLKSTIFQDVPGLDNCAARYMKHTNMHTETYI